MAKVLITGGAGFIGSHITEAYLKKQYEVVVVDDLSSGRLENLSDVMSNKLFRFYKTDIRNADEMEKIFADEKPDIVSHHAAQKSVPHSIDAPIEDADKNVMGLLNVLALVGKYKVKNVLYVSSGGALSKPIIGDEKSRESDYPQIESPYAVTKFAGENYVKIYSSLYGYKYSILRYANIYGPRQIADGECGVIPIFVGNVVANKPSILMTYADMPRGCTRDYVFVGDVVEANMLLTEKPVNCPVNVGTGIEVSMMDIYEAILTVFESTQPIKVTGPRLGDIKRSVLDASRLKNLVGWSPSVDLVNGLRILKDSMAKK
ncbi:MAG: NAD-dependent epimerase/dehydratase family protein [Christensenellaceae bacterium]|jgi:UDP-glucose 4-epimerase|nr:NAD-dependent epimerase/dehydratase family protein [Christensenellaceae bacterium]